jgi:hypothetical protein
MSVHLVMAETNPSAVTEGLFWRIAERLRISEGEHFFGDHLLAGRVASAHTPDDLDLLAKVLYRDFYTRLDQRELASREGDGASPVSGYQTLLASMPLTREIDWSWELRDQDESGSVLASSGNRIDRLEPGQYYFHAKNPGEARRIGIFASSLYSDRDNWVYLRSGLFGSARGCSELRLYFDICEDGIEAISAGLLQRLRSWEVPFAFKMPSSRAGFRRTDAAVLYFERLNVSAVFQLLRVEQQALEPFLRKPTPPFAKRLASGIAFAESPSSGESFGWSRMRLCALGLLNGIVRAANVEQRVEAIRDACSGAGIVFGEPFRNPGTRFPYDFRDFDLRVAGDAE